MRKFKILAIIFTIITSICSIVFLISLIAMLCLSSFNNDELLPVIILSLAGMGVFGPVTVGCLIPTIIFWALFGKKKKQNNV